MDDEMLKAAISLTQWTIDRTKRDMDPYAALDGLQRILKFLKDEE
jgi:hypothetical protein